MPIPHEDMLCRFIPGHRNSWSKTQSRPRPSVFKENRGLRFGILSLLLSAASNRVNYE